VVIVAGRSTKPLDSPYREMTYYRVLMNGAEIDIPQLGGGGSVSGFWVSRAVRAISAEEAAERAKALVLSNWSEGKYQHANRKAVPVLRVDTVERTSFIRYLMHPKSGFTFYGDEK
jgi:hypothetical protein